MRNHIMNIRNLIMTSWSKEWF